MESKAWFCYLLTGCRRESPCSILVAGVGVCLESSLEKTGNPSPPGYLEGCGEGIHLEENKGQWGKGRWMRPG